MPRHHGRHPACHQPGERVWSPAPDDVNEIRQIFGDSPGDPGEEIELAGYGYTWLRLLDDHPTTAIV